MRGWPKLKAGSVVSSLPVGWIKGADGKYDYDPAVKDAIRTIIDTFFQVRSIRRTVRELTKTGVKIPCQVRAKLNFAKPSLEGVRRILINPAYAGTYVFGKTESQRGGPVSANGQSARVKGSGASLGEMAQSPSGLYDPGATGGNQGHLEQ